jgi:hypothetical protein
MNWLDGIISGKAINNEKKSATNPALETLLAQVEREVIDNESGKAETVDNDEGDPFASLAASLASKPSGNNGNNSLSPSNTGKRSRVYGGPELLLSQERFERLHEVIDGGYSELVKVLRQDIVELLIDHSKLIDKLYKN